MSFKDFVGLETGLTILVCAVDELANVDDCEGY